MTIYEILKKLSLRKQYYVKFKFNLWFDKERKMTEAELLKICDLKSLNTFHRWERTPQFKHITSVVLATKTAADLVSVYESVKAKVEKDPNPKDIEMMLKLLKEINMHDKEAQKYFVAEDTEDEEDDLEI